ncbi:hypothetical protein [Pseudomonas sp. PvP028]|uniref:hypothetical protein n=1 Tax=Pseudomonas sp. PvP028 TaxID=2806588 RepID=UPI001AE8B5C1|nr:hypothetical protein [Pseudomonas sp. PvP028]MBP1123295.1 hypothetical protein [Pseudomonas sp. PvP028]
MPSPQTTESGQFNKSELALIIYMEYAKRLAFLEKPEQFARLSLSMQSIENAVDVAFPELRPHEDDGSFFIDEYWDQDEQVDFVLDTIIFGNDWLASRNPSDEAKSKIAEIADLHRSEQEELRGEFAGYYLGFIWRSFVKRRDMLALYSWWSNLSDDTFRAENFMEDDPYSSRSRPHQNEEGMKTITFYSCPVATPMKCGKSRVDAARTLDDEIIINGHLIEDSIVLVIPRSVTRPSASELELTMQFGDWEDPDPEALKIIAVPKIDPSEMTAEQRVQHENDLRWLELIQSPKRGTTAGMGLAIAVRNEHVQPERLFTRADSIAPLLEGILFWDYYHDFRFHSHYVWDRPCQKVSKAKSAAAMSDLLTEVSAKKEELSEAKTRNFDDSALQKRYEIIKKAIEAYDPKTHPWIK